MRRGAIRLAIASALEDVFLVGAAVRGIAAEAGLDAMGADQVELAVVEGVNNAIEHAYEGRAGERVEVTVAVDGGGLTIEIADRGRAMAWEAACAGAASRLQHDPLADGGRGLLIIREVMDEVAYHSDAGRNLLRLTKRLDGASAGAPAAPAPEGGGDRVG